MSRRILGKNTHKKNLFSVADTAVVVKKSSDRGKKWQRSLSPAAKDIESAELETPKPSRLFIFAFLAVILMFVGMGYRLFQLQVVEATRYQELSNGNRIRERISYAQRGRILDRNGKVIAENTLTFQLTMTPYLLDEDGAAREAGFVKIAKVLSIKTAELRELQQEEGGDYPLPLLVREDLSQQQSIELQQILPKARGFSIDEVPARKYNAVAGMAHIIGYVGRASPEDLENNELLVPVDFIGKAGIEKSYDEVLRGTNGREKTEVDALGRPVRLLAQKEPEIGKDIHLTIDLDLQNRLHDSITKQMKKSNTTEGSGVAIDPDTGEILAMVSIPYYDNNLFVGGIASADFAKLRDHPGKPLINRVVQAGYSSGSTIKPIVASGALKHGVVTPQTKILDAGSITVPARGGGRAFVFHGWRLSGLGQMDVRSALAWSSNIYFYTVGGGHGGIEGLGVERLTALYRDFGLGEQSGIDLPIEYPGRVPDEAWKKAQTGEGWYVGDSYNISIGQGDLLVSPLQLTLANMAVSNDGYLLKPQLVSQIDNQIVAKRQVRRQVDISKDILQIVREGMRQVLTNGTTCDCVFSSIEQDVAGKSGTAQTTSDESRRPHAWYTAFAPWEDPQIHATVMIEEGAGGSKYAAPAIAELFDEYFN